MSNLFSGAKGKALSQQGVYMTPGFDGDVKVERCLVQKTRKGQAYIVEFEVVKSANPQHPVGAKRSWIQSLNDQDIGFRAVKAFCVAASGINPKLAEDAKKLEEFENQCEEIMTASDREHGNVFAGTVLRLETTNKPTKKGEPFTLHVWTTSAPSTAKAA